MLPEFILPETIVTKDGGGPAIALREARGSVLRLTLGITNIVEQESLDLSIHGSVDGVTFDAKPIAAFPQKFYCGTYVMVVDLEDRPEITHVRVQWKLNRWGRGGQNPMFGLYVFGQTAAMQAAAAFS